MTIFSYIPPQISYFQWTKLLQLMWIVSMKCVARKKSMATTVTRIASQYKISVTWVSSQIIIRVTSPSVKHEWIGSTQCCTSGQSEHSVLQLIVLHSLLWTLKSFWPFHCDLFTNSWLFLNVLQFKEIYSLPDIY